MVLFLKYSRVKGYVMRYPEYLSSAKRHNYACRVLKAKIDSLGKEESNDDEFKFLVLSLYYLSGYIVECSLKFKIFEISQYDSCAEVNKAECSRAGIDYTKRIKTHSFERLQEYLDSLVSGFSHVSENQGVNRLLNEWNPELRYTHIDLDYNEIKELYNHTSLFLRKM